MTTIMLGGLLFPAFRLIGLPREQKEERIALWKGMFFMGLCELFGFVLALGVHAAVRGSGDLWADSSTIYQEDVHPHMNYVLENRDLSLKAKRLLSKSLSLPKEWDYT